MFELIAQAVMLAVVVLFYIITCKKIGEARDFARELVGTAWKDALRVSAEISRQVEDGRRIASRIVNENRDNKGYTETANTEANVALAIARKLLADTETVEKRICAALDRVESYAEAAYKAERNTREHLTFADRARQIATAAKDTACIYANEAKASAKGMREVKPAPAAPVCGSAEAIRAAVRKVRDKYANGYDVILEYIAAAHEEGISPSAAPFLDTIEAIAQANAAKENEAKA